MPGGQFLWNNQNVVYLMVPGVRKPWATVYTKRLAGVDLMLNGPKGAFQLGSVAELGADRALATDAEDRDQVKLRFVTTDELHDGERGGVLASAFGIAAARPWVDAIRLKRYHINAETASNTLLAPRFLFRFAVPVLRREPIWKAGGVELDESYRLLNLAELDAGTADRERRFADVRMAWSAEGLVFNVRVDGKQQPVWCREGRLEDSDGFQVWIDTRATLNIHRASRYCHRYAFLPAGGGRGQAEPVADQLLINRARENARPIRPRELQVASKADEDRLLAGRVRAGRGARRLRPAAASADRLHVRRVRPRTGPADVRDGAGVSVRRRPDVLGGAGIGRKAKSRGRISACDASVHVHIAVEFFDRDVGELQRVGHSLDAVAADRAWRRRAAGEFGRDEDVDFVDGPHVEQRAEQAGCRLRPARSSSGGGRARRASDAIALRA